MLRPILLPTECNAIVSQLIAYSSKEFQERTIESVLSNAPGYFVKLSDATFQLVFLYYCRIVSISHTGFVYEGFAPFSRSRFPLSIYSVKDWPLKRLYSKPAKGERFAELFFLSKIPRCHLEDNR